MSEKLIWLVSFVLALGLVDDVQAANLDWIGDGPGLSWNTPDHWGGGALPTSADLARISKVPGPVIDNEGAIAYQVFLGKGNGTPGEMTVDGGTLTVTHLMIGRTGAESDGTLNMRSGSINVITQIYVGRDGSGTINMTGGTINITGPLYIPRTADQSGRVNLEGGTINAVSVGLVAGAGTMDVAGGTLILDGNDLEAIQGYIDAGSMTAYQGNGTFQVDYDVTNEGKTTLKAIHKCNPSPADGGSIGSGEVELNWTLPDPCVPGQPVAVDVYFTDDLQLLEWFTDPAAIQVVSKQNVTSAVVQTQPKTWYYWAVDTYIGDPNDPIFGPIFSFLADNQAPQVDAGADVVTWLQDGVRVGNLDATVTDEDAHIVQWWTVVSEPNEGNAVIEALTAEDTSITLAAVGEYVLQLEAFDSEYTGSDTVTINVYNDSCQAAQSLPDYVPLVGDLNADCKVDDVDLALLQENWLKDSSLTEEWFKVD